MNKPFNLYCDIDSTINNHRERIKRNTVGGWPGTAIDLKAFTRDEVMQDVPVEGAVRALNAFAEKMNIIYLTSRGWDPDASVTREWLELHGFPIDDIIIVKGHEQKLKYLTPEACHLYIDDFTIHQEQEKLTELTHLMNELTVPYIQVRQEDYASFWKETTKHFLMELPNGEFLLQNMIRNLSWWRSNRQLEEESRSRYYKNFLKALNLKEDTFQRNGVVEFGGGPLGGMIGALNMPSPHTTHVDLYAQQFETLHFYDFSKSLTFETPFEKNSAVTHLGDYALSYNALDHGWDIRAALRETARVVKKGGFLAFDCKGINPHEHDKLDHYQVVHYEDVRKHLEEMRAEGLISSYTLDDLTKIKPDFNYEHNWGFEVALITFKK